MGKVRQDAWLEENDELLAETVIRHVREGSTQLNAFEEAGDLLNRTAAACGFRWNAVVRQQYDDALREAKQDRKETMRVIGKTVRRQSSIFYMKETEETTPISLSSLSLDIIIAYLVRLQQNGGADPDVSRWRLIAQQAQQKIAKLQEDIAALESENATIRQDYDQFVSIMNRARRFIALENEDERTAPIFQMEKNGNLVVKEIPMN